MSDYVAESRERMERLRIAIGEAIVSDQSITCAEVLLVLGEYVKEWGGLAWSEDIQQREQGGAYIRFAGGTAEAEIDNLKADVARLQRKCDELSELVDYERAQVERLTRENAGLGGDHGG